MDINKIKMGMLVRIDNPSKQHDFSGWVGIVLNVFPQWTKMYSSGSVIVTLVDLRIGFVEPEACVQITREEFEHTSAEIWGETDEFWHEIGDIPLEAVPLEE